MAEPSFGSSPAPAAADDGDELYDDDDEQPQEQLAAPSPRVSSSQSPSISPPLLADQVDVESTSAAFSQLSHRCKLGTDESR